MASYLFLSNPSLSLYLRPSVRESIEDMFSVYLPDPSGCDTRPIFKWSLTGFEFRVFLLDWLPYLGQRAQSAQLFTHCWRKITQDLARGKIVIICMSFYWFLLGVIFPITLTVISVILPINFINKFICLKSSMIFKN